MRFWLAALGVTLPMIVGCSLARSASVPMRHDDGGGMLHDAWSDLDAALPDAWSPGVDADTPPVDADTPPVDAHVPPPDAWTPPSCTTTYNNVYGGYHFCSEAATTCAFIVNLDHGDSCNTVCNRRAGGCVGAYQNGNSSSSCTEGTDDGCGTGIGSMGPAVRHICVCARF